jgi:transposase InsO family protein
MLATPFAPQCVQRIRAASSESRQRQPTVESFNGRLRDECLNEHWFTSLIHARSVIEAWRREYNEERPKRVLGGLTPAEYALRLADQKVVTMPGKL